VFMEKLEEQKKAEADQKQDRKADEVPAPPPRRPKKPPPPEEQTRLEFPETGSEKAKPTSKAGKSRAELKDTDQRCGASSGPNAGEPTTGSGRPRWNRSSTTSNRPWASGSSSYGARTRRDRRGGSSVRPST